MNPTPAPSNTPPRQVSPQACWRWYRGLYPLSQAVTWWSVTTVAVVASATVHSPHWTGFLILALSVPIAALGVRLIAHDQRAIVPDAIGKWAEWLPWIMKASAVAIFFLTVLPRCTHRHSAAWQSPGAEIAEELHEPTASWRPDNRTGGA